MVPDIEVARYALRTFVTYPVGDRLRSVVKRGHHWHDGTCVAQCLKGKDHEAPAEGCSCGIYGTLSLQALERQFDSEAARLVTVIAAEGRTIIGDTGLRTSAARVVAYWSPSRTIRKSCKKQFRGSEDFTDLNAMLTAYKLPRWENGRQERFWSDTLLGTLTAATSARLAQQYADAVGGARTYVSLHCGDHQIGGPVECALLSRSASTLTWASTTFEVPESGELTMTLSATPDGPAVDRISLGEWTLPNVVVTPTYEIHRS